ncbi:hypothetical protein KX928_17925 [Roseobacter sp. YSTF-M11]|uniref:Succinate dehydrogenase n=1 Tax=Roseobacter insulae TaxID=2859783 RepID=A0A9X1FYG3_9RHOB|nr:hypothetical protein [Roseobacter insulae]MBW4709669.1 hypothetical protein [Roseobacter insulae]
MIRLLLPALLLLAACADVQRATDTAGRNAAKSILPEALAVYFPQVPKQLFQPFTNCIVDNADASEVQSLAADAITGVDEGTAATIRAVLSRPGTQQCLTAAAPAALQTL